MSKVLLFNPRAAESKARVPNSILSIAASIEGKYDYAIVDGNLEKNPLENFIRLSRYGEYDVFAMYRNARTAIKTSHPFYQRDQEKISACKNCLGRIFCFQPQPGIHQLRVY